MMYRLVIIALLSLASSCSTEDEKCKVRIGKYEPLINNESFKVTISQIGQTSFWLDECHRSFFTSPGSDMAMQKMYDIASKKTDGESFSGFMNGKIVYLDSLKRSVVKVEKVNNFRVMDGKEREEFHSLFVSQVIRSSDGNDNVIF